MSQFTARFFTTAPVASMSQASSNVFCAELIIFHAICAVEEADVSIFQDVSAVFSTEELMSQATSLLLNIEAKISAACPARVKSAGVTESIEFCSKVEELPTKEKS